MKKINHDNYAGLNHNSHMQQIQAKQSSHYLNHSYYEPNRVKINSNLNNPQPYIKQTKANQGYNPSFNNQNNLNNISSNTPTIIQRNDQINRHTNSTHMSTFSTNQYRIPPTVNNSFANSQYHIPDSNLNYQPPNPRITNHVLPNNTQNNVNNTKIYTPSTVRSLEYIPKMF
jgi:hypothetical protein